MLLVPLLLALALPLIVGQATEKPAVYRYTTPFFRLCTNIQADIHCCNALTIIYLNLRDSKEPSTKRQ